MSILGKIFKSKLDQRQFDFSEKYWDDLEKQLDAHSGKGGTNPLRWISFSVIATAVLVSVIWFFYPKKENEIAKVENLVTDKESTENVSTEKTEIKKISENSVEDKIKIAKENNFRSETEEKNSVKKEEPKNESLEYNENKISHRQKMRGEDAKNSSVKSASLSEGFFSEREKNILNNDEKEISEDKTDNLIAEKIISENSNSEEMISQKSENNFSEEENQDLHIENFNLNFLLMNRIIFSEIPKNNNEEIKTTIFKEKIRKKKNSYFIGAYAGMMYSDKILESTDTSLTEYISRRKNEESAKFTKNLGIDFGVGQDCWSISTGINYHEQGEIINYKPEFYQWLKKSTSTWDVTDASFWKTDTVNTLSYIVATGGWDTVSIQVGGNTLSIYQYVTDNVDTQNIYITDSKYVQKFDSTEIVKTDSAYKLVSDVSSKPGKTISKISYYEIPVLIGYEFPISRVTLMFRTGFSIGMLSKVSANYLKNDISGTEEISIERMNKTMLNYILRTGVSFYCTEHIILNFEPMFRTNINSVFKNENFTQKYWNAGINAGVIYRF